MENFTLQAITRELALLLKGQRLGKVYQLGATDLALDFRLRDGRWLIVSTDPQRLALYLTRRKLSQLGAEARAETPFVSLLKKYLAAAPLVGLDQSGYDRVVCFNFAAETEDGGTVRRALIVELTGRSANVLLLDQDRVIATLRARAGQLEDYRAPSPPDEKLDPFSIGSERLNDLIAASNGDLAQAAQRYFIGFGPLYARELAARARSAQPEKALHSLLDELYHQPPHPHLYSSVPPDQIRAEIGRADFSLTLAPIPLHHLTDQVATPFATINEAADAYFTLIEERRSFLADYQQLKSALGSKLRKQRELIKKLQRDLDHFTDSEKHQRYGELLLVNLHQVKKTEHGFLVTDFYDEAQPIIEIPAANKSTAREAAEHYFKLARKARHARQAINQRLPEIEREVAQLEAQLSQLATITRRETLIKLAQQAGISLKQQQSQPTSVPNKTKEEYLSGVRRYRSSDGYEILVGRTDRDNDELTFRFAKSFDLWFHAADYPGSHVVLRNPQRKPVPPRAITEAAQLAAKFSQARNDAHVAVNYCERKFVSKPKGFAPGQVRLASFKTLLVEPREAGQRIT
jgi:predicted ribosome quality control (RQC) complex YloA/Tae2 family protein